MKVYAKTIPNEHIDYVSLMEPYIECGKGEFAIEGNRDYEGFNLQNYEALKHRLCNCVNEEEVIMHIKTHFRNGYDREVDDDAARLLYQLYNPIHYFNLMTGKNYTKHKLVGYSQGEVVYLYAPSDTDKEVIDTIEALYWGSGTEIMIHDEKEEPKGPEDIYGFTVFTTRTDLKNVIAEEASCDVDDVVLYEFDGYIQTPKYNLV